jgi:hypothetical protein
MADAAILLSSNQALTSRLHSLLSTLAVLREQLDRQEDNLASSTLPSFSKGCVPPPPDPCGLSTVPLLPHH